MRLDAAGKACPIPVIMAKKELDNGTQSLEIIVDGQTQIDNLERLGNTYGRPISTSPKGELGLNLAKMAIYTLSESENIPTYVLFMNDGVKLTTGIEPQIIDNLNTLIEKGAKVLVCGTCLNFFGIKDDCKIGTVSNMFDILGAMQAVSKVITL